MCPHIRMGYSHTIGGVVYRFDELKTLLARATPARSGDELAGLASRTAEERVAAQMALADLPLKTFRDELLIPYETDEVTRLILDTHDQAAFAPIASFTVGAFRDWLLRYETDSAALAALGDPDYYRGVVDRIRATRDCYSGRWAEKRGWFTFPSETNFICTEPRDSVGRTGPCVARSAYDFLFSRKVLVRHFPSDALTASCLRITVGSEDEMLVLDDTLDAWLKAPPNV